MKMELTNDLPIAQEEARSSTHSVEERATANLQPSLTQWYREGNLAGYVCSMRSPGGILNMIEAEQPAGDVSRPAFPELTIYQDMLGGSHIDADIGGGKFRLASERGGIYIAAPDFANDVIIDNAHRIRALSFPLVTWQDLLDEASDGRSSLLSAQIHFGQFRTPIIESALRSLWAICDQEGAPSRLLARAAGCEILAEMCRLGGTPFTVAQGGLAPWAERRCKELIHARMAEDITLDELAGEARLSPFHFARMFKHSVGVPPRVYLTRVRMERACELLETTDLPVTEIANEVGYSSNQVLARVFLKHQHMSPTDYRRAVRDPTRTVVKH